MLGLALAAIAVIAAAPARHLANNDFHFIDAQGEDEAVTQYAGWTSWPKKGWLTEKSVVMQIAARGSCRAADIKSFTATVANGLNAGPHAFTPDPDSTRSGVVKVEAYFWSLDQVRKACAGAKPDTSKELTSAPVRFALDCADGVKVEYSRTYALTVVCARDAKPPAGEVERRDRQIAASQEPWLKATVIKAGVPLVVTLQGYRRDGPTPERISAVRLDARGKVLQTSKPCFEKKPGEEPGNCGANLELQPKEGEPVLLAFRAEFLDGSAYVGKPHQPLVWTKEKLAASESEFARRDAVLKKVQAYLGANPKECGASLVRWLKKQDDISDASTTTGDVSFTFWDGQPVVLHCSHEY